MIGRIGRITGWVAIGMALAMPAAIAADPPAVAAPAVALGNDAIYEKSLAALTMLLVVATLLESAFTPIFNWRVFQTYLSARGVKTIIMVLASWLVVHYFKIDIMASLIAVYLDQTTPTLNWFSGLLTALILAGGSVGVFNLLYKLGYRTEQRAVDVDPRQLNENEAWIMVRVKRVRAVGQIQVHLRELGDAAADPTAPAPIIGVIGRRPRLSELLFRNVDRFPPNGGYSVKTNTVYALTITGSRRKLGSKSDEDLEPFELLEDRKFVFGRRAIVDFDEAA